MRSSHWERFISKCIWSSKLVAILEPSAVTSSHSQELEAHLANRLQIVSAYGASKLSIATFDEVTKMTTFQASEHLKRETRQCVS